MNNIYPHRTVKINLIIAGFIELLLKLRALKIFLHTFETCPFFDSAISISVRGEEEAVIQAITHQRPEPGENILREKICQEKILYVQEDELSAHPYLTRDRCLGENSLIYGLYSE